MVTRLRQYVNRTTFFAIGIVFCLVGIGFFVGFVSGKSTMAAPTTPGTCLPISKGGTGCDSAELLKFIGAELYPVGTVLTTTTNTNPGSRFGGTWQAFGSGRTLVGVDGSQTEFDTAEESGGSKTRALTMAQLPNYRIGSLPVPVMGSHALWGNEGISGATLSAPTTSRPGIERVAGMSITSGAQYGWTINSRGSNEPHNNLQPYITVYFWKRTS